MKRATIILIKYEYKPFSLLLRTLLVFIHSYLKSFLR